MCGFLGWVGESPPFAPERFESALKTLVHRGPDDEGIWRDRQAILGHRRLAIIDLSSAGHQPMVSPNGDAVLVFNGEIYNYLELKEELQARDVQISGGGDTGVLLAALQTWGTDAFSRLNGMWSFGLWQPDKQNLILCRDRFGVKPLYYTILPHGGIAFGSEPKALLELMPSYRCINERMLLEFLVSGQLYSRNQSFYEGIYLLPPARYAVFDARTGSLVQSAYWDYPTDECRNTEDEEALARFQAVFDDAVRLRLRSDVPVGLTLSGGLDSTAVLTAARKHAVSGLACFTSVYDDNDRGELDWAKIACEPFEMQPVPAPAVKEDWLSTLPRIAYHMDGPGYSPAVYPLWCLMRKARARSVPVLLEGQGADELLAGYPQYSALEILSYFRGMGEEPLSWSGVSARLRGMRRSFTLQWTIMWMLREAFPFLLPFHRRQNSLRAVLRDRVMEAIPAEHPSNTFRSQDAVLDRLVNDHARDILPGLLHYGDAISMAHSIEARQPFLDYRVVELVFRLRSRFKLRDGETKWILREYLRRNNQQRIGNRRDKRGYPTPASRWMAEHESRALSEVLLDPGARILEWCDRGRLERFIARHKVDSQVIGHHLYKLLSTEVWIRTCVKP